MFPKPRRGTRGRWTRGAEKRQEIDKIIVNALELITTVDDVGEDLDVLHGLVISIIVLDIMYVEVTVIYFVDVIFIRRWTSDLHT